MAGLADGGRAVVLMALEADAHGGNAGGLGHSFHILHLSMAHLALHSRVQMFAMCPIYSWENFINAYPGNGLAGF